MEHQNTTTTNNNNQEGNTTTNNHHPPTGIKAPIEIVNHLRPSTESLNSMLQGKQVRNVHYIPEFQRGYEWTSSLVNDLLNELIVSADSQLRRLATTTTTTTTATTLPMMERRTGRPDVQREMYLMGTIIILQVNKSVNDSTNSSSSNSTDDIENHSWLKKGTVTNSTNLAAIVDGQQRFISLLIILAVVRSFGDETVQNISSYVRSNSSLLSKEMGNGYEKLREKYTIMMECIKNMLYLVQKTKCVPRVLPMDGNQDSKYATKVFGPGAERTVLPFTNTPDTIKELSQNNPFIRNFYSLADVLRTNYGLPKEAMTNPDEQYIAYHHQTIRIENLLEYIRNRVIFTELTVTNPDYVMQVFDVVNKVGLSLDPIARFRFHLLRHPACTKLVIRTRIRETVHRLTRLYANSNDLPIFNAVCFAYLQNVQHFYHHRGSTDVTANDLPLDIIDSVPKHDGTQLEKLSDFFCQCKEFWETIASLPGRNVKPRNKLEWSIWELMHLEDMLVNPRLVDEDVPVDENLHMQLTIATLWKPVVFFILYSYGTTNEDSNTTVGRASFDYLDERENNMYATLALEVTLLTQIEVYYGGQSGPLTRKALVEKFNEIINLVQRLDDDDTYQRTMAEAKLVGKRTSLLGSLHKYIHGRIYGVSNCYANAAARHLLYLADQLIPTSHWINIPYGNNEAGTAWHIEHLTAKCIEYSAPAWTMDRAIKEGIISKPDDYEFYTKDYNLHRLGNLAVLEGKNNHMFSNKPLGIKLLTDEAKTTRFETVRMLLLKDWKPGDDNVMHPDLYRKRHTYLAGLLYVHYGIPKEVIEPPKVTVAVENEENTHQGKKGNLKGDNSAKKKMVKNTHAEPKSPTKIPNAEAEEGEEVKPPQKPDNHPDNPVMVLPPRNTTEENSKVLPEKEEKEGSNIHNSSSSLSSSSSTSSTAIQQHIVIVPEFPILPASPASPTKRLPNRKNNISANKVTTAILDVLRPKIGRGYGTDRSRTIDGDLRNMGEYFGEEHFIEKYKQDKNSLENLVNEWTTVKGTTEGTDPKQWYLNYSTTIIMTTKNDTTTTTNNNTDHNHHHANEMKENEEEKNA